jgi:hypothetical protein
VTATTAGLPGEAVPASYQQLDADYGGAMRRLVRRQLGPRARPEDVEDVYQYILVQLMPDERADPPRRGILAEFDPGYAARTGQPGGFAPLLFRKVVLYCRGQRESLTRRGDREWQVIDADGDQDARPWVERFGGTWDDYPVLEDGEVWQRMLDHLATVPARPGTRPLGPLLEHLAGVIAGGGTVGPEAVRREFGLNRAEAGDYLGQLRLALGALRPGAEPASFDLGGMTLTPAELLAHIEALRANPGHHVVGIWKRAGLKLAGAGKTWYLPLAFEEMRLHPESKQAAGTNVPGGRGSPVKHALIRVLERMLTAEATWTVPPPPAVTAEAALRAVPGMTEEKLAAALAALEGPWRCRPTRRCRSWPRSGTSRWCCCSAPAPAGSAIRRSCSTAWPPRSPS